MSFLFLMKVGEKLVLNDCFFLNFHNFKSFRINLLKILLYYEYKIKGFGQELLKIYLIGL